MTYILRVKFNIEFRRFNYSALIRSGQLKKEDALKKMEGVYASEDPKIIELCIKRLGLSREEIDQIIKNKPKNFRDFKTNYNLVKLFKYPIKLLCKMKILPPSLYLKFFT